MTDYEREQAYIKKTPQSAATEQVQALWGEIDYLFQEGIVNREIQLIADEVDELRTFIESCLESNAIVYRGNPAMTDRRTTPEPAQP